MPPLRGLHVQYMIYLYDIKSDKTVSGAIRRFGWAVCAQLLSELGDFLLQQLVFAFLAPQKLHQQVQFSSIPCGVST